MTSLFRLRYPKRLLNHKAFLMNCISAKNFHIGHFLHASLKKNRRKSWKMPNIDKNARSGPICGGLPPFFDLGTLTIVFSGRNGFGRAVNLTEIAKMILSWTTLMGTCHWNVDCLNFHSDKILKWQNMLDLIMSQQIACCSRVKFTSHMFDLAWSIHRK